MKDRGPTFSSDGPECPRCGYVITPDELEYFDPDRYTQDMCPECGEDFAVEVMTSVDWRCTAIPKG